MEATIFLAELWGPAILAVGVGVFFSKEFYIKIYRDIDKNALAVLIFGMVAIVVGIVHVKFHNVWDTLPQIIISFLGWALLLKGIMFAVFPNIVNRAGYWEFKHKLVPVAGILMLIVRGYLSWIAYFA